MLNSDKVKIPIRNWVFLEHGYEKYKLKTSKRFFKEKVKVFHAETILKHYL